MREIIGGLSLTPKNDVTYVFNDINALLRCLSDIISDEVSVDNSLSFTIQSVYIDLGVKKEVSDCECKK